jgi:hypothetical protein
MRTLSPKIGAGKTGGEFFKKILSIVITTLGPGDKPAVCPLLTISRAEDFGAG